MDPIMLQKIQSIKNSKKHQFLDNVCLYSLAALTCSIFYFSPFWFPSIFSSFKVFLFISLPKISSVLFGPKLLFLVANLIVVVLVGESKFFASNSNSSARDVYPEEFIDGSSQSVRKIPTLECREKIMEKFLEENVKKGGEDGKKLVLVQQVARYVEVLLGKEDLGAEDALTMPTDELNRRADDFIARVNKQRMLEARLLLGSNEQGEGGLCLTWGEGKYIT